MAIPASITPAETAAPPADGQRVVLSVRNLRKAFGGQVVLDGANADLMEGEVVLLRGDNGSGKTTLLNILTGNLEPDMGTILLRPNGQEETFRFPRRWWESLNPFDHFTPERVASEAVGRTWQDVRLFPTLTLRDNIAVAKQSQSGENPLRALVPRLSFGKGEASNRRTSSAMLAVLGLAGRELSSGDKISLGQSKRVAIARAVQAGARILFLDEPLSGLDAAGVEDVLGLLTSLARKERLTLVIVEHTFNIPRVLAFASSVWTLRQGQIQVQSPVEARGEYSSDANDGAIALIAEQLGDTFLREDMSFAGGARLTRFFPKASPSVRVPLLEVRDLVVRRGPRLVIGHATPGGEVEGLSFKLYQGEMAVFQAPNGWGKTTLVESLLGLIPHQRGQLYFHEKRIDDLPVWQRVQRGLSLLRSREEGFPNLKLRESIKLSSSNAGSNDALPSSRERSTGSLSGGEKQWLAFSLVPAGSLAFYDEPFSAMDRDRMKQMGRALTHNLSQTAALIAIPSSPDFN